MQFQKGQKAKLADLGLAQQFIVGCSVTAGFPVDITCFGLDENNKLSDDRYMIFYNQKQSPVNEIKLLEDTPNSKFDVNLNSLPASIVKLVFTAAIDGGQTMKDVGELNLNVNEHSFKLTGNDFAQEKAVMVAEIYKKEGVWRLGAVGQGFNGGLHALLTYFGGQAAEDTTPVSAPATPPVDLKKKVFLEKRVSLEKKLEQEAPKLLNLSKKAAVSLEKRGLGDHRAKVALCLDISGSMANLYKSGFIQQFAERILALGCRLDDDGSIDIFLFGARGHQAEPLEVSGFAGYVPRMLKQYSLEGDTKYAAAIELVRKHYTPYKYERSEPLGLDTPVYVMFITDGQPSDKAACTKALKNASYEPIFWQFMGLQEPGSYPDFSYLEKLDDLDGRYVDNADFFSPTNLTSMTEEQLYEKLTNEYPSWVKAAKAKGLIVN